MARIPMGNGGQRLVGRAPMVNIQQAGQTVRAVQDMAGTVQNIAMAEQGRRDAEAKAEQKRQADVAEAARRARDGALLQDAENQLREKHDDLAGRIMRGEVDKGGADQVWAEEAKKIIDERLKDFGEESRPLVAPRLQSQAGTLVRSVRRTVEKKHRDDISADMVVGLENLSRSYRVDPQRAEASMNVLLDSLGPHSNYSAEQLAKMRQGWKEGAQFTTAYEAVSAGRDDPRALVQAKQLIGTLSDLDPQRRATLIDRADAYAARHAQQRELQAARAQRLADARLNQASAEFQAAQTLITQGRVLRPELIERVTQATAGTPFQAAFRESLQTMGERTAFGSQPLAVQAQALQQARASLNAGTDPASEKHLSDLQRLHDAQRAAYEADPMTAGLQYGLLDNLAPLALNDIGSLTQTMGERVAQAKIVQAQTGRPVSPLTQPEAEQLGQMLAALPAPQKASAVASLSRMAGPEVASALAAQVAAKDRPLGLAMAAGVAQTTAGRFTSELILKGAAALKDKTVAPDTTKDSNWRKEIADAIGDAYPNEQLRQAAIDAAYYIRAGLELEGRSNNRQAVRLATGGIVERNRVKVPLPYGMDADTFDKRLRAYDPAALGVPQVYVAGQPMGAAQFVDAMQGAALVHAGPGRYAVRAGGRLATRDAEGRLPVIIEVR